MSADTGAVDAVEQAVIAQNEYFNQVWAKKQAYSADEVACGAMQAAIQAFQRANAARVTALVDAVQKSEMRVRRARFLGDSEDNYAAQHDHDVAWSALLLAVVGPEVQG